MTQIDANTIGKDFFRRGNPIKKLLKITLDLLGAEQAGVLFGTDESQVRFIPTADWDRGVMDMFDGKGLKGLLLKLFGTTIVTFKNLSPIFFYKTSEDGLKEDNDGIIAYMLRNCADYYTRGVSIIFSPDISGNIYKIDDQYAEIPFYSYNGSIIHEPDIRVKVDLNIIKHFHAKNFISIYIPDYGILVVNTADPDLLGRVNSRFAREKELKEKFDVLIELVEIVSLATLGQLKGKRGAHLLWQKEKQLRRTSSELVENEKKYRDLYENAPVAYFSINETGTVLKCNYNTLKLFGYERQELIGSNILDLYVDSDEVSTTPEEINTMLRSGKSAKDIELKFRNKRGKDAWASVSLDAVRNTRGRIIEIRAMATDISHRKSLEKQLFHAQKMEAVGTLAGGIAHDFNNILSPISGYAEMLLMDEENDKRKKDLKVIHDCSLYATGLVNQILTFSRQQETRFKLLKPQVIVEDILTLSKSFLPSTIEIQKQINSECGPVMADPVQANQVLMNLISNAYHAMGRDGGVLGISLDEVEIADEDHLFPLGPGRFSCLKISDTGSGMPPEVVERIFDPFFTTKTDGKGSGIGLSVVHGIIESHKGHITVASEIGKGTHFCIYLPVYEGNDIELEDPQVKRSQPVQGGDEHILLVDDDERVAFMVSQMLEKLGYAVTCHLDSPDALADFKDDAGRFDMVITDLTMPELTGYQLAKEITQIRTDIPVILCTGFGEHIDKKEYSLQGIKGFLTKPVSVKSVSGMIREILDKSVV